MSYVAPDNRASRALVARLGGSETGRLDGALVFSYPLADAGAQEARP